MQGNNNDTGEKLVTNELEKQILSFDVIKYLIEFDKKHKIEDVTERVIKGKATKNGLEYWLYIFEQERNYLEKESEKIKKIGVLPIEFQYKPLYKRELEQIAIDNITLLIFYLNAKANDRQTEIETFETTVTRHLKTILKIQYYHEAIQAEQSKIVEFDDPKSLLGTTAKKIEFLKQVGFFKLPYMLEQTGNQRNLILGDLLGIDVSKLNEFFKPNNSKTEAVKEDVAKYMIKTKKRTISKK